MKTFNLESLFKKLARKCYRYTNKIWYGPMLALLAILDSLILVIPTDGILISSAMLARKRWLYFGLSVAIGSTIGGLMIVYGIEHFGIELVHKYYPNLFETTMWIKTEEFFKLYGLVVLFIVGIAPITQQPALILAGLSKGALLPIFLVLILSRLLKFLIVAYIASHTPKLISKLWGFSSEIKNADVHIKN